MAGAERSCGQLQQRKGCLSYPVWTCQSLLQSSDVCRVVRVAMTRDEQCAASAYGGSCAKRVCKGNEHEHHARCSQVAHGYKNTLLITDVRSRASLPFREVGPEVCTPLLPLLRPPFPLPLMVWMLHASKTCAWHPSTAYGIRLLNMSIVIDS